jgi:hypothetical protein
VTGSWRKLHNKELHNLYSSPDTVRPIKSRRRDGRGMKMVKMKNKYGILVGNPAKKRPLRKPKCRWEDNITLNCPFKWVMHLSLIFNLSWSPTEIHFSSRPQL